MLCSRAILKHDSEGTVVTTGVRRRIGGVPFTEERVDQLLELEPIAPGAAGCLALAWQHRDRILDR
jgi:hypothetical protein